MIETMSIFWTLPLQSAWQAMTGFHMPTLADIPFPVPPGIRHRGREIAFAQSGRLKYPCKRAVFDE